MMRTKSRIRSLIDEIETLSNINIFQNTRRREVVEVRSLLYTILRNFYRFNLREIQDLCSEYGYEITHGIVLPETQNHLLYEISNDMFSGASSPCEYQYGLTGTFALMIGFAIGLPPLWNIESGKSGAVSYTHLTLPTTPYV